MSFTGFQQQDFTPPPPPTPPQPIPIPLPEARPSELTYRVPVPQARPQEPSVPLPQARPEISVAMPMPPERPGTTTTEAGSAIPLPQASPLQAAASEKLIAARQPLMNELQNPHVRDWLIAYTKAEVGSQGKQAQHAFMETVLNRAAARHTSIEAQLADPKNFYPPRTHRLAMQPITRADRDNYMPILAKLPTSNISNFSTGNASGEVGFNKGGPPTNYGGENFAVEGPDKEWATAMGFATGPVYAEVVNQ